MTPLALIRLALRDAGVNGVGQTPSDEENNDVFTHLNMMLAGWARRRWLVYHLLDIACVSTGAQSYTITSGGDFDTPRPDRIEAAFIRYVGLPQPNQPDYPVQVLQAREDYNRVRMKGLLTAGQPNAVFYDPAYPVGMLYWTPIAPASAYEMHVSVKQPLAQFADLITDINLPDEYLEALLYNLAVRCRLMFGMPPDPKLDALANATLNTLRLANVQIPQLAMPSAVLPYRGRYNIYSDQGA